MGFRASHSRKPTSSCKFLHICGILLDSRVLACKSEGKHRNELSALYSRCQCENPVFLPHGSPSAHSPCLQCKPVGSYWFKCVHRYRGDRALSGIREHSVVVLFVVVIVVAMGARWLQDPVISQ
jgi:hypothetical protein